MSVAIDRMLLSCRCSACGGKISRINLMILSHRATWGHPTTANLITNYGPCAMAVLCDACVEAEREPREAVDVAGDTVRYHSLDTLQRLPPEPTATIYRDPLNPSRTWIYCLRCDRTSHHPDDVLNRYCGYCHAYHEAVVESKPEGGSRS